MEEDKDLENKSYYEVYEPSVRLRFIVTDDAWNIYDSYDKNISYEECSNYEDGKKHVECFYNELVLNLLDREKLAQYKARVAELEAENKEREERLSEQSAISLLRILENHYNHHLQPYVDNDRCGWEVVQREKDGSLTSVGLGFSPLCALKSAYDDEVQS